MDIITNDKKFDGAIVLEKGTSVLAKLIIFHMGLYAFFKKLKPVKYSHAETLIWNYKENQLYTVGAREKGTELSKIEDYYDFHEIKVLLPIKPLTEKENASLWKYYDEVKDNKYQTFNFLAWIFYLRTFIWISIKGDKRNYCYELAARFSDKIKRWKGNLDRVSIYDLALNKNYKEI